MAQSRITRQQLTQQVQNENLKALLENQAFVKFIWTILNEASIFYPTFSRRSPHETSYYEGRRSLGLEVLHMLKYVRPDILGLLERAGNLLQEDIAAATPTSEDIDASYPVPDDDEPGDLLA